MIFNLSIPDYVISLISGTIIRILFGIIIIRGKCWEQNTEHVNSN